MEDMNKLVAEVDESLGKIKESHPEFISAFHGLMVNSEKEGALSAKTKEIISVALAVSKQCDWCIAYHVKNAMKEGATKDELMEACFVTVLMGGGPSLMYTQSVMKAIEDFKA